MSSSRILVKKENLFILLVLFFGLIFVYQTLVGKKGLVEQEPKSCQVDSDCVVFGKDGDCNCGCFNKNYQWKLKGECFCAAPLACQCVSGECQAKFEPVQGINSFQECVDAGNPVMESYPRQCMTKDGKNFVEDACSKEGEPEVLTITDARKIAVDSECGDRFKEN
jgi:hypothetical protein